MLNFRYPPAFTGILRRFSCLIIEFGVLPGSVGAMFRIRILITNINTIINRIDIKIILKYYEVTVWNVHVVTISQSYSYNTMQL